MNVFGSSAASGGVSVSYTYADVAASTSPAYYYPMTDSANANRSVVNTGTTGTGANATYSTTVQQVFPTNTSVSSTPGVPNSSIRFRSTNVSCPSNGQNCWDYEAISRSQYTIQNGDRLEYDMYLEPGATQMGVDFTLTAATGGAALRDDVNAVDTNGLRAHPELANFPTGQWIHRSIIIPPSFNGKVIDYVDLVSGVDNSNTMVGRFANIGITNGGVTKKSYWNYGDAIPTPVQHLASHPTGLISQFTAAASPVQGGQYQLTSGAADSFIQLPQFPASTFSNGFTYNAWVFPTNTGSWSRLFEVGNGVNGNGSDVLLLARDTTSQQITWNARNSAGTVISSLYGGGTIVQNQWQMVTLTVAANGTATIYVNGNQTGTAAGVAIPAVTRSNNFIARSTWANDGSFGGGFSQVGIWNTALTGTQVQNLYASRG